MDSLEPNPAGWEQLSSKMESPVPQKYLGRSRLLWGGALSTAAAIIFGLIFGLQQEESLPKTLPDITLMSSQGEMVSLSSLKGQVVLLEFWASYCNECTEKNCTELLPIYDEYKHKGFEIYAVSLDSLKDQWLFGIERDRLPWIQVSDLQGFASPVSQMYGIDKTNTTFLLNQEQEIIGKNLNREELIYEIERCYQSDP